MKPGLALRVPHGSTTPFMPCTMPALGLGRDQMTRTVLLRTSTLRDTASTWTASSRPRSGSISRAGAPGFSAAAASAGTSRWSVPLAWSGLGTYVAQPPLMKTFEMIGNCATPLCLILFGCSMRDLWHNMKWEPKPIICGLLTRLGLAPALLLLMAYFLPVDDYIKRVIIIQAAIPSAVIPVILAKRFGGHPDLGTQILLTTTVASFLTLPCWLALGSTLVVPLY